MRIKSPGWKVSLSVSGKYNFLSNTSRLEAPPMKIAELSARSGVPVGTIKFYLRERLLPRGRLRARNQAEYDARHLERLRLVGTLTATAGVGIGEAREIIRALEVPNPRAGAAFRMAFDRLGGRGGAEASAHEARELEQSKAAIAAFLRAMG